MNNLKIKTTSIIVDIPEKDLPILQELAKKKKMTLDALLRQAYRQYQAIDVRLEKGEISQSEYIKLFATGMPIGCGGED